MLVTNDVVSSRHDECHLNSRYRCLMRITNCIDQRYYSVGLLLLNFVALPEEVADVDKNFFKAYHKFWIAEIFSSGERKIVGSVALKHCDGSEDILEVKVCFKLHYQLPNGLL